MLGSHSSLLHTEVVAGIPQTEPDIRLSSAHWQDNVASAHSIPESYNFREISACSISGNVLFGLPCFPKNWWDHSSNRCICNPPPANAPSNPDTAPAPNRALHLLHTQQWTRLFTQGQTQYTIWTLSSENNEAVSVLERKPTRPSVLILSTVPYHKNRLYQRIKQSNAFL